MKRLTLLVSVLLLTAFITPVPAASAGMPSNAVTVSVSGNGTWSGSTLLVSLSPGESKPFGVEVHNNLSFALHIRAWAEPGCNESSDTTACFSPAEATLAAGATSVFNLTIAASGAVSPGVFSINLTIDTDTEAPEPVPVPAPHHMTLMSTQSNVTVGSPHDLTATVFDQDSKPFAGAPVTWTIASGSASFSSKDNVTGADGRAVARLLSSTPGSSVVRCAVTASLAIMSAVTLAWITVPSNGDGNGDDEPDGVSSGLPAWAVFLIFIAIIGGCIGGYTFYKRWRERRSTVDPLLQGVGGGDTDLLKD